LADDGLVVHVATGAPAGQRLTARRKRHDQQHRDQELERGDASHSTPRVAASLHAAGIRLAESFVVFLVVPDAIERAAAGPDQPADQRALAGSLATAGDRATGRADRRGTERADAGAPAD